MRGGELIGIRIASIAVAAMLLLAGPALAGSDDLLGGGDLLSPAAPAPDKNQNKSSDKAKDDDLLQGAPQPSTIFTGQPPAPAAPQAESKDVESEAEKQHAALFEENEFPSAQTCATCHPKQFREWSVSQHAYSQLSPVFTAFQRGMNLAYYGSNGDFCFRCHTIAGANFNESTYIQNLDRHPASREGITCVTCHRVIRNYNKISGRIAVAKGPLTDPVYGPTGDAELKRVLADPGDYKVVTDPKASGRKIHADVVKFEPLESATFCGTCHDVTMSDGARQEEAFSEYRTSPAARQGITCQDCHMGKVQGANEGYDTGPAAVVGGVPTHPRKLTSHLFSGPDFSLIHPGLFPHNEKADRMASLAEWLQFDYEAGWGTDKFEKSQAAKDTAFPDRWRTIDDRYDARAILDEQFKLLDEAAAKRLEVLRNGFQLGEVRTERADRDGIRFAIDVKNATSGHNVPTGITDDRLFFLDVAVTDAAGATVFRSGDRDKQGDVRDALSYYVRSGDIPIDDQLFSLRSTFMVKMQRGADREAVFPVPYSPMALPYVRPPTNSSILVGRPLQVRSESHALGPLDHRWATYSIAGDKLTGKSPYHVTVKLICQPAPVNLIATAQFYGFEYHMSARQLVNRMIEGTPVVWQKDFAIDVK